MAGKPMTTAKGKVLKIDCSIGDYHLQKYKNLRGQEGYGYECDVYMGNVKVAEVIDFGDGAEAHVFINSTFTESDHKIIVDDMKQLLGKLKGIDSNSLCYDFDRTVYSAVEGFAHLLMDLKPLVKQAQKSLKGLAPESWYAVGAMGSSWLNTYCNSCYTAFFHTFPKSDYKTSYEKAIAYAKKNENNYGPLVALAVLQGDFDWRLSFDDYAALHNPYEK